MTLLQIDLETYSSVDIKKSGVYPYVEAPDFEILLFAYAWDDEPVQVIDFTDFEDLPNDVFAALTDEGVIKTAFNANFERTALAKHLNCSMPPEQWRCSSVHALTMGLPGDLDGAAKVLKVDQQKDSAGKALIKYFSVPCKPTKSNGGRTRNMPHHDPVKWLKLIESDPNIVQKAEQKLSEAVRLSLEKDLEKAAAAGKSGQSFADSEFAPSYSGGRTYSGESAAAQGLSGTGIGPGSTPRNNGITAAGSDTEGIDERPDTAPPDTNHDSFSVSEFQSNKLLDQSLKEQQAGADQASTEP
jgi:hypothetical protein